MDTGFGRLTTDGVWVNAPSGVRTSLKGRLHGNKTDEFADFFGVSTPVKDSPFDIDYDLHWRAPPRSPDVASLNGIIKSHLGKGQFTDLSTGHAGQLLRLLSVDALLRKLRFDFSDTFSEGFTLTRLTVRHGLRMAYCIPMIRWWMVWRRTLP